jgi:hypothetical protein
VSVEQNPCKYLWGDKAQFFKSYTKLSAKPTANEKSTGLCLMITNKIVLGHGGKFCIVSSNTDTTTIKNCIDLGAANYILKNTPIDEIKLIIQDTLKA